MGHLDSAHAEHLLDPRVDESDTRHLPGNEKISVC